LTNVAYLSGPAQQLNDLQISFGATPDSPDNMWQLGLGAVADAKWGAGPFLPHFPSVLGRHDLVLTDKAKHVRRVVVEVIAQGSVLMAGEPGVYQIANGQASIVAVRAVEGTFQQNTLFQNGTFVPASEAATVANGAVSVPAQEI